MSCSHNVQRQPILIDAKVPIWVVRDVLLDERGQVEKKLLVDEVILLSLLIDLVDVMSTVVLALDSSCESAQHKSMPASSICTKFRDLSRISCRTRVRAWGASQAFHG